MLNVKVVNGTAVEATSEFTKDITAENGWQSRWDWKTMERAQEIAAQLTEATGTLYLGIDQGSNVSPRYDVIKAPAVGDEVSRGFNGDYYPEGTITKISASLKRIETSTGKVFFRRRNSGTWLEGKTFALVQGHINERNPSF